MQRLAPLLIIAGPTAVGKTQLGLQLAAELGGEIVNVDSVQVYRGMDIGSAKPSLEERSAVPHHLFDIFTPDQQCTVAQYVSVARDCIADIQAKNKLPVLVGGTGLYITALLHGLADLPKSDPDLRSALEARDSVSLLAELRLVDPMTAEKLHVNDRIRIIRALESYVLSGQPVSIVRDDHAHRQSFYDALVLVPLVSREVLYRRINERSQKMLVRGLLEETRRIASSYTFDAPALDAIGYRESVLALQEKLSMEELPEAIARNTRRFAKRQITYWRNEPKKRGWQVRPTTAEFSVSIAQAEGEFARPIDALPWDNARISSEVRNALQRMSGTNVWFVQAPGK